MFCDHLCCTIRADYHSTKGDKTLHIAARLMEIYRLYKNELKDSIPPFLSNQYVPLVQEAMRETSGNGLPNFLSHPVFHNLYSDEAEMLGRPTFDLLQKVLLYYKDAAHKLCELEFNAFPKLKQAIDRKIDGFLDECHKLSEDRISHILEEQISDIFTLDGYYENTFRKMKQTISNKNGAHGEPSSFEINDLSVKIGPPADTPADTVDMQISLFVYWNVANKRLSEGVVMALRQFFDNRVCRKLMEELQHIPDTSNLQDLMEDPPEMATQRADIMAGITRYNEARELLQKIAV